MRYFDNELDFDFIFSKMISMRTYLKIIKTVLNLFLSIKEINFDFFTKNLFLSC